MLAAPIKVAQNLIQVLVCDSSADVRKDLRHAMESAFSLVMVHEAGDGRAALSLMALQRVDLIVTDLGLAANDGNNFLDLLMSNQVLSRKPVLALAPAPVDQWEGRLARLRNLVVLSNTTPRQSIANTACVMLGQKRSELAQAS